MKIPEKIHEGATGKPVGHVTPVGLAIFFFKGGFRQAKSHVVAQTKGYHLICIWDSLVKFQGGGGGGVVLKFDVFSHFYAVFLCYLHASNDTLLIMFQVNKQLNWWLKDLVLLSSVGLGCFWETSGNEKMALQSVTLTLKLSLEMPYFRD